MLEGYICAADNLKKLRVERELLIQNMHAAFHRARSNGVKLPDAGIICVLSEEIVFSYCNIDNRIMIGDFVTQDSDVLDKFREAVENPDVAKDKYGLYYLEKVEIPDEYVDWAFQRMGDLEKSPAFFHANTQAIS